MTNDGNPQPLAVIIGERLKAFRAYRDLRQADIALAATECGLAWSRSSVAALESGARNLSVEELILLPFVISNAGGWDEPLIPSDVNVRVAKRTHLKAEHVPTFINMLFTPISHIAVSRTVPPGEEESVRWDVPPVEGFATELDELRARTQVAVWRLIFSKLYPWLEFDQVIESSKVDYELLTKITDRLEAGWEDLPVPWFVGAAYGWAMWGKSPAQERDRRAGTSDDYASKRSLQSARGHITRELIREIQDRINADNVVLDRNFRRLHAIWDDPDKLKRYEVDSYAEADANRQNAGEEQQVMAAKTPDLSSQTIGEALRAARLQLDLSVEEVSALTRVRIPLIEAIEEDDFSLCMSDVYARGYIRTIARTVGLTPQPLLDRYDAEFGPESGRGHSLFDREDDKPKGRRKLRRKNTDG